MRVVYLPSSVGGGPQGMYLTTFIINDTIAIDAGCLGYWRTSAEQSRITDVFLTHSHLDHVGSLPMFLNNVYAEGHPPVRIHASPETWATVENHVFTDETWAALKWLLMPSPPLLEYVPMTAGQPVRVGGLTILPVEVNHPVKNLGLLISDGDVTIAIPSDTGPTAAFWAEANDSKNLQALFLECSFPDHMNQMAEISGHLTPSLFQAELAKLDQPVRTLAVHLKPACHGEIVSELEKLDLPQVEIAEPGRVYEFG